MKNHITYLLLLVSLIGCSAEVSKDTYKPPAEVSAADSINVKNLAAEHFIIGSIADLKGQYAEAILEYQEALRLDPQPGIYYALGKDYFKLNKLSQALGHSKKSVELEPNNTEYNTLLAKIFTAARQNDSALVVYEKIISIDSSNINAYYNLGMLYEKDRPMQALGVYRKLLEITGPEWSVLVKIADLNERMGNVEETIQTFEELLELNPSSLDLQKILIESYIKAAKYDKALSMLNIALTLFPSDINLIEYKANIFVQKGNWREAAKEYFKILENEKVPFESKIRIGAAFLSESAKDSTLLPVAKNIIEKIDRDTTDWQVKVYLGEIAIKENNDSLAIQFLTEASKLAAWNSQIWVRLGVLLFENGKYKAASEEMQKAVKNFPDEYLINMVLGLSLSQQNAHTKAKPYLQKAVNLNPNDVNALSAFGFTLNQLKEDDEALYYLNKAISIDPNSVQVLGMMGMIYDSKKMWKECDASYEKALRLDSTDATLLNNYAYSLAERGIELERALKMSQLAVDAEPENSSFLDTIGWIYFKLGELERAKTYIDQAVKRENNNATLLDHLGDVIFKLGDKARAVEIWKEAFELDSTKHEIQKKIETGEL